MAELLKQQTASTSTSSQVVNGSGDDLDVGGKHIDRPATEKSSIESTFEAVLADAMGDDSGSHDGVDKKPCNPESIVPLPPDLPDSLTELIEQIKQVRWRVSCEVKHGPVMYSVIHQHQVKLSDAVAKS